jgi:uncharacterized protein YbjT (DUF2867 family)
MKVVVIGGTGLIGSKLVSQLRGRGHEVVAASPASGVNTLTGEGLAEVLVGAKAVVDVANSPVFQGPGVQEFFETSGRNLLAAERAARIAHHLALSVVGTDRLADSDYFRGKIAQERLIESGGVPYTILHSTQFLEFLGAIAQSGADESTVRLPPAFFQPVAADDVVGALADLTLGEPVNGTVEIAGPERARFSDMVGRFLRAKQDPRSVMEDADARYFGARLSDDTLVPGAGSRIGTTSFDAWMRKQQLRAAA